MQEVNFKESLGSKRVSVSWYFTNKCWSNVRVGEYTLKERLEDYSSNKGSEESYVSGKELELRTVFNTHVLNELTPSLSEELNSVDYINVLSTHESELEEKVKEVKRVLGSSQKLLTLAYNDYDSRSKVINYF